ncbi:DNA polymerase, beta domain protein region (fragment) [Candidatus Nitrospira nitrosa]|uniref:DNA polymerase, beta domain protein region n=1 Tax=Candidatus Nitrospira nitrosa TaxID=1742972 RepID=A0A0S4LN67_9BACT
MGLSPGSDTAGPVHLDSDQDPLTIEASDLPRYRRVCCVVFRAKDIVVWTPQEVEEGRTVPNAFISTI